MNPKCYIHLGKAGDLIILLPGWRGEYQRTGVKPIVMVSKEFAPVLEGVSYVEPWVVPLHWYGDCGKARLMAEQRYGKQNCVFPKWWDDPTFTPPAIRKNATQLIIHGKRMQIEEGEWFSYMASQWKYAGFPIQELFRSPVFDLRRVDVEEPLADKIGVLRHSTSVLFCLNTGGSSPFPYKPEIERMIYSRPKTVNKVDLMQVRAPRIFDLLTAIERSVLVVTSDTAILHLCGATRTPYVAFVANGGGGSIPRGNCILNIRYANTLQAFGQIEDCLKTVLNHPERARLHPPETDPQPETARHLPDGSEDAARLQSGVEHGIIH